MNTAPTTPAPSAPAAPSRTSKETLNVFEAENGVAYAELPFIPHDPTSRKLYVEARILKASKGLLLAGKPIAYLGATGSGKTDVGRALFNRFDGDFHQMEFGGVTSGDALDGLMQIVNGETKLSASEHLIAVRKAASGLPVNYLQDELNRCIPMALNKTLRLYSHQEYVSETDGVLYVEAKNLRTIATLNVGNGFSGTTRVDDAIANRYRVISLPLPPGDVVEKVLKDRYTPDGITEKTVRAIGAIYRASLNADETEEVYRMGVRDAMNLAEGVVYGGLDVIESVELLVAGAAAIRQLPEETSDSLIAVAKSVAA